MLVTYIVGSLALIVKPGPDLTCTIATARGMRLFLRGIAMSMSNPLTSWGLSL